jgi:multicomponent Na+:H+ antiporter subunit D
MFEHPVVPFVVAAALLPFLSRRGAAAVMLAAPAVAALQLRALDDGAALSLDFFGFELQVLRLDALSTPFAWVFVLAAFLAGLFGATTLSRAERAAAVASAGFGLGVVLAGDLLTLFVMWEMKAVASAVLIALGGRTESGRAAYRYLVFHVTGGSLLLGGILWHLSAGGSLSFDAFAGGGAASLVLVAFLLAAAAPPLHPWLPDAYPEASVAGTVFLSAFTTKAAVYALLRGFPGTDLLIVLGVAMALYGVVYAVLENDLRRLLGYHIISQVGYMVAAAGIGTAAAINGATAHAFAHILYKGLLLMGVGALIHATGRGKLTELGGLARAMPLVLGLYLVGAFSISGVPLFSGFVSKELVIDAASGDGREVVVYLLKLASVGTFLHTGLKLPWFAWGGPSRQIPLRPVPIVMLVAMGITAAANVAIGLHPGLLYDLLPHPVEYRPFTAAKLSEMAQLLTFTALAFWLLVKKLGGEPTLTLDTDWLYRRGSNNLVTAARPAAESARVVLTAPARRVVRWGNERGLVTAFRHDGGDWPRNPAVTPTVALGIATLGTAVLVLAWSLLS